MFRFIACFMYVVLAYYYQVIGKVKFIINTFFLVYVKLYFNVIRQTLNYIFPCLIISYCYNAAPPAPNTDIEIDYVINVIDFFFFDMCKSAHRCIRVSYQFIHWLLVGPFIFIVMLRSTILSIPNCIINKLSKCFS